MSFTFHTHASSSWTDPFLAEEVSQSQWQLKMTLMHQDLYVSQQWEVIKFWYARMEERLHGKFIRYVRR